MPGTKNKRFYLRTHFFAMWLETDSFFFCLHDTAIFSFHTIFLKLHTMTLIILESENENKIAQGEINIFSHLIYAVTSLFRDFDTYTGSDFLNRKNIIRIVFRRSELVKNDTSLADVGQFWFWRQFWVKNAKNRTRGSQYNRKLPTDFADFQ